MQSLKLLFKQILNENPNQAIKFLTDKNLNPSTTPKGKQILDSINNFTRGDGYTYLLTKFHVNDRIPMDELQKLHNSLRANKVILTRLPKPVVAYETYRQLINDINYLESQMTMGWLLKQLSQDLRSQIETLSARDKIQLTKISQNFKQLKPEKQKQFMKKAFSYKDIREFMSSIEQYINTVNNELDYDSVKEKIQSTSGAYIVLDSPEKNILIAFINSFDALKTLGCTSAWCIAKDMARYRGYKQGGKKYFLIWDFNFFPNNSNFFIATAYNRNDPNKSATHEHINNGRLFLLNVLDSKDIDVKILDDFIDKYQQELLSNAEMIGLMKAFQEENEEEIINLIERSEIINEYRSGKRYPSVDRGEVIIGLTEDEMKNMLELDDEFDYVYQASNDYGYNGGWDSDEETYMHSGLNKENIDLLIDIAKKLGIPKNIYRDFDKKEGAIAEFLRKYGMEQVIEEYVSEYNNAGDDAEKAAAQELISHIPFDLYYGSFKINDMMEYMVNNEIKADNFDELISAIKDNLPSFSIDQLQDARYSDLDLDGLNKSVSWYLEKIIDEIDINESNPYYDKAKAISVATDELSKMGFKIVEGSNVFAKLKLKNSSIIITEIDSSENEEGDFTVYVNATIKYVPPYNADMQTKKIRVPLQSLKNYIGQYVLPLHERLSLLKIVMK